MMADEQATLISSTVDADPDQEEGDVVTEETSERIREALRNSIPCREELAGIFSDAAHPLSSSDHLSGERLALKDNSFFVQDHRVSSSTPIEKRSRHNSFTPTETHIGTGNASSKTPAEHSVTSKVRNPTILDYLYTELRRGYDLGNDEQRYRERREKFYIFMKIPVQLEKVCPLHQDDD